MYSFQVNIGTHILNIKKQIIVFRSALSSTEELNSFINSKIEQNEREQAIETDGAKDKGNIWKSFLLEIDSNF